MCRSALLPFSLFFLLACFCHTQYICCCDLCVCVFILLYIRIIRHCQSVALLYASRAIAVSFDSRVMSIFIFFSFVCFVDFILFWSFVSSTRFDDHLKPNQLFSSFTIICAIWLVPRCSFVTIFSGLKWSLFCEKREKNYVCNKLVFIFCGYCDFVNGFMAYELMRVFTHSLTEITKFRHFKKKCLNANGRLMAEGEWIAHSIEQTKCQSQVQKVQVLWDFTQNINLNLIAIGSLVFLCWLLKTVRVCAIRKFIKWTKHEWKKSV